MFGSTRLLAVLLVIVTGCASVAYDSEPQRYASGSFADAINGKDIEAAMAHWSEDALLYFQAGGQALFGSSPDQIRKNYEQLFKEENLPPFSIQVQGMEILGEIAHEWGTFRFGETNGCYLIVRRAVDDWKIYREWIVEPCGR